MSEMIEERERREVAVTARVGTPRLSMDMHKRSRSCPDSGPVVAQCPQKKDLGSLRDVGGTTPCDWLVAADSIMPEAFADECERSNEPVSDLHAPVLRRKHKRLDDERLHEQFPSAYTTQKMKAVGGRHGKSMRSVHWLPYSAIDSVVAPVSAGSASACSFGCYVWRWVDASICHAECNLLLRKILQLQPAIFASTRLGLVPGITVGTDDGYLKTYLPEGVFGLIWFPSRRTFFQLCGHIAGIRQWDNYCYLIYIIISRSSKSVDTTGSRHVLRLSHTFMYCVCTLFARCTASGLYEKVVDQLVDMREKVLANVDYIVDFTKFVEIWSSNIKFQNRSGTEFCTNIVGEIAGPAHGTTRDGVDFRPVDDNSNIKDILVLAMPTDTTTRLANLYKNQTVPLRTVIVNESIQDEGKNYILRPWLHALRDDSTSDDIIIVHMLPKYGAPVSAGTAIATASPIRRTKRKLDDDGLRTPLAQTSPAISAPTVPDASDIKLGAFYDPRLLPDYGGNISTISIINWFNSMSETAQTTAILIPPWKFYERLRPGMLVLVHASLHIFLMGDDKRKRKIYQINVHSIKVLSDSDSPVVNRTTPVPKTADPSGSSATYVDHATSIAFDTFNIALASSSSGAVPGPSALVLSDIPVDKDSMDIDTKTKKPKKR
ncbi:hypothetical protein B0H10DRAFT_1943504 [Mycena sp. CBHHK59/15]|nr:hypothetical protein B0H10DRAFT_1943504 [Mycena sp. CBHHK59/15]